MPKYDRNFTDELRERLSIVDIVGRRVPLVKKGQNYWETKTKVFITVLDAANMAILYRLL